MGKFVKQMALTREIDGDTVVFTLKPISTSDLFGMTSADKDSPLEDKEKAASEVVELFKKYLVDIKGAKDENGDALAKEDILDAAYFMAHIADVSTEWLGRSMPKNSVPSAK